MLNKIKSSLIALLLLAAVSVPTAVLAIESQYVYVEGFSLADSSRSAYKVGDSITGSFILRNAGLKDASNISYKVSLIQIGAPTQNKNVKRYNVIASDSYPALGIAAKSQTAAMPFSFSIPGNAKGDNFEIKVEAVSSAGFALGWAESMPFSIENPESLLAIRGASVSLSNGEEYQPNSGFVLHGDREARSGKLTVVLGNDNDVSVMTYPVVNIYAWPISDDEKPVLTIKADAVSVGAKATSSFAYEIPAFDYAPGIYEGTIDFNGKTGSALTRSLTLKYAIGGEMATIHSLTASNDAPAKGDTLNVNASITGMPADFSSDRVSGTSSGPVKLRLSVVNERGSVIAEETRDADLSHESEFALSPKVTDGAKATRATLTVENAQGKILARYESDLSADYLAQKAAWQKTQIMYAAAAVIAILAILAIVIKRRKGRQVPSAPSGPLPGTASLMLLAFAMVAAGAMIGGMSTKEASATTYNTNPGAMGFVYRVLDWFNYDLDQCAGKIPLFTTGQPWFDTNWQDTPRGQTGSCGLGGGRAGPSAEEWRQILIDANLINNSAYDQTMFVSSPAIDAEYEAGDPVRISAAVKYTSGGFNTGHWGKAGQFYIGTVVDSDATPTDLALDISGLPSYSNDPKPYGEGWEQTWGSTPVLTYKGEDSEYLSEWTLDTGGSLLAPNTVGIHKFWIGSLVKNRAGIITFFFSAAYAKSWIKVKGYQTYKVVPSKPASFGMTAVTSCDSNVSLKWVAPGASALTQIDGYRLYRTASPTGTYVLVNGTIPKTATSVSDSIPASMNGTLYYRLVSYNTATGFESKPVETSIAVVGGQVCPSNAMSCSVSPSSPLIGSNTTWVATPAAGDATVYSYAWSGAVSGSGQSVDAVFGTAGTKTATVTGTAGGVVRSASCSVVVDTSSCTPTGTVGCPGTVCVAGDPLCTGPTPPGNSCSVVADIPTGSSLTSAAGLCAAGAALSNFNVNAGKTGWVWQCRSAAQPAPSNCSANCASGIYSAINNVCSDIPDDLCSNLDGRQVDGSKYDITGVDICSPKTGSIKYFKFLPDTAEASCPAYWDTELPDPSSKFVTSCTIGGDSAIGAHQITTSNRQPPDPQGRAWFLRPVGKLHTLTCEIKDDLGVSRKTLTASARCFRIGEVNEI